MELPDINELPLPNYGYKRKRNEIEETVIGKCHFPLCELPLYGDMEIAIWNGNVFCCRRCRDEYRLWEDENK
jgi:hypothetical protein